MKETSFHHSEYDWKVAQSGKHLIKNLQKKHSWRRDFSQMLELSRPWGFRDFILPWVFSQLLVHSDAKMVSLKYYIFTAVTTV
jgi:hypothetical protein